MTASSTSSIQAARQALADRLREIRVDAGLTAKQLAAMAGWHRTKVSKLEHAATTPSDADLRAWCRICGAEDKAVDLILASRAVDSMYVEWRRLERGGLRHLQETYVPLYERTRLFRIYQSHVVPGLLQAPAYARALLTAITAFRALPDDVDEAAVARLDRSRILYEGDHRFAVVLEEAVLRYRVGGAEQMTGQLGHLLTMTSLPSVSLGIIPFSTGARAMWTVEGFTIYDETLIHVELLSAKVSVTAPGEIAQYSKAFTMLAEPAVYGARARELIMTNLDRLR